MRLNLGVPRPVGGDRFPGGYSQPSNVYRLQRRPLPAHRIPEVAHVPSVRLLREEQLHKDAFEQEGPLVGEPLLPDLARPAQETVEPLSVRAEDEEVDVVVRSGRSQTVQLLGPPSENDRLQAGDADERDGLPQEAKGRAGAVHDATLPRGPRRHRSETKMKL